MIENISDQLGAYMEEVETEVSKLAKQRKISYADALKIAEIATRDIQSDAVHHIGMRLEEISESIADINIGEN